MKQAGPYCLVLFQEITVRWHKASRGAPGAGARNRVPEYSRSRQIRQARRGPLACGSGHRTFSHPGPTDDRPANIFLHHLIYDEGTRFQAPSVQHWIALRSSLPKPSTLQAPYWNVPPLTLAGDGLQVEFSWSHEVGAPPRYHRHERERVQLAPGQWLQVRYNGRHIYFDDGTWYYEKHVLNIGFADAFVPTLFVAPPPDDQITDFVDLH